MAIVNTGFGAKPKAKCLEIRNYAYTNRYLQATDMEDSKFKNSHKLREKIMKTIKSTIYIFLLISINSCSTINRMGYMHSSKALKGNTFIYKDGGESIYYSFNKGNSKPETIIFFYAATGCSSLKAHMPDYVNGLSVSAKIFALNKRYSKDKSLGFHCGGKFHLANNFNQWVADYSEFIMSKLKEMPQLPKNIVLVGVSEAAITSLYVTKNLPIVTHLAIIGDGGFSMRKSLTMLKEKGAISFDVEKGWIKILENPNSIKNKWYGNTYKWWYETMDIKPLNTYLSLDIPILLGMGVDDKSVPIESAIFLKTEFEKAGKNNLSVIMYPDVGHTLIGKNKSYRDDYFNQLSILLK